MHAIDTTNKHGGIGSKPTGSRVPLIVAGLWLAAWLVGGLDSTTIASPCPSTGLSTVCADLTEPAGVTNLLDTQLTFTKNGTALPVVTIPATAPTGGGVVNNAFATTACASDTYGVTAISRYQLPLGIFNSLSVASVPLSITKDRTTEAACLKPPTNFTLH